MQRATCGVFLLLLISLAGCAKEAQAPLGSTTTTTTLPPPPQANLVLGQEDGVLGPTPGDFQKNGVNFVDASGVFTPSGVAVDNANNRLYVADTENSRILGYSNLSTLISGAPADIVIGQADLNSNLCNRGGAVSADTLCRPRGVAVDSAGNLYVADTENNRVLEYDVPITTGMTATRVFGQQDIFGNPDFNTNACDQNSSVSASTLCSPKGVTVDGSGNLYVADTGNNRVLEYDTPLTTDTVADHVFGQGDQFTTNDCNNTAPQVGNISDKSLCLPTGIALDSGGNLYIADTGNHRVLEYNTPLTTDTKADVVIGQFDMNSNFCNQTGVGPGGAVDFTLCGPEGVALDSAANLYVADTLNNRVLEYAFPISTDMSASIAFGQVDPISDNSCNSILVSGLGPQSLCFPKGIALDNSSGNLYVADTGNSRVLRYPPPFSSGEAADLVLGQNDMFHNGINFVDAVGLNTPRSVAVDLINNRLYVADTANNRVLGYSSISALVNGSPASIVIGQLDMNSNLCDKGNIDSNGLPVPDATTLCGPRGVAVDSLGNLYVADTGNNRVLEYHTPFTVTVVPGSGDTTADRVFGQGDVFDTNSDGLSANRCNNLAPEVGDLSSKSLCLPEGVAVDSAGNVYVADTFNNRVLEYNTPIISGTTADRVFGQGNLFNINECNNPAASVGGLGAKSLCFPEGVALDTAGNLYIADTDNNRVLEYDTPLITNTMADRFFGQPDFTSNGINANNPGTPPPPSDSSLFLPAGVAADSSGNLYVADTRNSRVLEYLTPLADNAADQAFGEPDFVSGLCNNSTTAIGGISNKSLCFPEGVALDSSGSLYVADTKNHRVLRF